MHIGFLSISTHFIYDNESEINYIIIIFINIFYSREQFVQYSGGIFYINEISLPWLWFVNVNFNNLN